MLYDEMLERSDVDVLYIPLPTGGDLQSNPQRSALHTSHPGTHMVQQLGPPARCPVNLFLGEGSPTKMDKRKRGTLILTSLLEDPDK